MTNYYGKVIDNNDPQKRGRIKVRVRGVYDTLDEEFIPWALPRYVSMNQHDLPPVGAEVSVSFLSDDIHLPTWYSGGAYTNQLDLGSDYVSGAILLHKDLSLYGSKGTVSVYFSETDGIYLTHKNGGTEAKIRISTDGEVELHGKGRVLHVTNGHISLGQLGKASEPCVLGNKNADVLGALNDQDNKIVNDLIVFLTAFVAVASPNPMTVPLVAPAQTLLTTLTTTFPTSYANVTGKIPSTKSTKTSLD